MDVAAYSTTNNNLGNTYVILSADPKMNVTSPQFERHAAQLERALKPKGFERVSGDQLQNAALGIYVSSSISDPSKRYHQVQTTVLDPGAGESVADSKSQPSNGPQGTPMGTPSMSPAPEPAGLSAVEKTSFATTVYTKRLQIRAVDLQRFLADIKRKGRDNAVPIEVWSVDVESTGQPDSLSDVIPVMIAAAQPYIAGETGKVVRVSLSESDQRVATVKSR